MSHFIAKRKARESQLFFMERACNGGTQARTVYCFSSGKRASCPPPFVLRSARVLGGGCALTALGGGDAAAGSDLVLQMLDSANALPCPPIPAGPPPWPACWVKVVR